MKPRRRIILKVLLLLATGATLNVAVAWGLALWISIGEPWKQSFYDAASVPLDFQAQVPAAWMQWPTDDGMTLHTVGTDRFDAFGLQMLRLYSMTRHAGRTEFGDGDQICVVRAGWPLLSLNVTGVVEWPNRVPGQGRVTPTIAWTGGRTAPAFATAKKLELSYSTKDLVRPLPLAIAPVGFAINTVFYTGVLWMLLCGPFALRRMIRRRRGQCAHCAYPIGQHERCTECGVAVTVRTQKM